MFEYEYHGLIAPSCLDISTRCRCLLGFTIPLFYPIKTDHICLKLPVILRQILRKGKFYRYKKK